MNIFNRITTLVFLLLLTTLINAQTSYTSVLSGEWDNPAVWSPSGVPGAGDNVHIDQQTIVSTNGQREVAGFSTLVGGELALSGTDGSLTITGNGYWGGVSGGGIIRDVTPTNNGVVTIASGAVLEIDGNQWSAGLYGGARLLNQGTVRMVSGFGIWGQDGSVIENQALFEIDTAGNFGGFLDGGIFINTNTGTFRKSSGMGTCNFNANWEFRNMGGTIDVQSGSVTFNCDGIFNGGSYNADAGALLHFDAGDQTFEGTLSGAPAGRIEISAGVTANTGVSGVTFDFQGTGFAWSGGTFDSSMITIPSTGLLVLDEFSFSCGLSGGTKLTNLGTIRQDENLGFFATDSSIIDNQSLYEIVADNGSFSGLPNGGILLNTGILHNMGSGTCKIFSSWKFRNMAGGIINIASGTVRIDDFENNENAIIKGIGTIFVPVAFINDGTNAPGNSAGILTYIRDYNASSTGALEIELAGLNPGTEHDQLSISGNAVLNGTLNISLINGYVPAVGDSFIVLTTTGSVTDSFETVNVTQGLFVDVHNNSNNVVVVIDSVGTIVSVNDPTDGQKVTSYALEQNYPNPFNPSTKIIFAIPIASSVRLDVYNILGEKISTLLNTELGAGRHEVNFDARNLASGTYIYRIQAGSFVQTKKMLLLK